MNLLLNKFTRSYSSLFNGKDNNKRFTPIVHFPLTVYVTPVVKYDDDNN